MQDCTRSYVMHGRCSINSRMWRIPGYHYSCEYPDLLHCLYLGTVRDATASHLMGLASFSPQLQTYDTWDERLHHLHGDFQMWCREHHFRPSLLDGLSHLAELISAAETNKVVPVVLRSCLYLRSGQAGSRCGVTRLSIGARKGLGQSGAVAWHTS